MSDRSGADKWCSKLYDTHQCFLLKETEQDYEKGTFCQGDSQYLYINTS